MSREDMINAKSGVLLMKSPALMRQEVAEWGVDVGIGNRIQQVVAKRTETWAIERDDVQTLGITGRATARIAELHRAARAGIVTGRIVDAGGPKIWLAWIATQRRISNRTVIAGRK